MRVQGPGARSIYLKLEGMQRSGSFKLRGALNKVLCPGDEAARGVVTASGGNHGLGLACVAWLLKRSAHLYAPSSIPPSKLLNLQAAILTAQRRLWEHLRLLVEPGAAVTLAALAEGCFDEDPGPIALVLGGANVDPCSLES